jgi:hypothetical protein
MAEKNPWFKLFAKDLLADENLKACSMAARGMFIYMLSLMHRSGHRGHLCQINNTGKPMDLSQLSLLAGCETTEAERLVSELISAGVFAVSSDRIIYSRRMVREERISKARSESGAKGGRARVLLEQNQSKMKTEPKNNDLGNLLEQNGKQNPSKGSSKMPSKPLGMGITNKPYSDLEEEKSRLDFDPPRDGGVGEGILLKQNSSKTENTDLSPEWLARVWCNECRAMRGRIARDKPEDVSPQFTEWIAFGVPAAEIDAEMRLPRDRTEHLWQFKQRLFGRLGVGKANRKTKAQTIADDEAAFNDELAKLLAENPAFKDQPK